MTKIDESAFDGCCPVLVALHTPVSEFDAAYKPNACAGFAKAYLNGMELDSSAPARKPAVSRAAQQGQTRARAEANSAVSGWIFTSILSVRLRFPLTL